MEDKANEKHQHCVIAETYSQELDTGLKKAIDKIEMRTRFGGNVTTGMVAISTSCLKMDDKTAFLSSPTIRLKVLSHTNISSQFGTGLKQRLVSSKSVLVGILLF